MYIMNTYMCQGLNYVHIIGDGHQPNSVGVYIPIIRIPIKGGRSPIPNIGTFDHGTYIVYIIYIMYIIYIYNVYVYIYMYI